MDQGTLSADQRMVPVTSVSELGCKGLASHDRWRARQIVVVVSRAHPAEEVHAVKVHVHYRQGEA